MFAIVAAFNFISIFRVNNIYVHIKNSRICKKKTPHFAYIVRNQEKNANDLITLLE